MKFHQLPIGARFGFRGATFEKVSPLKAHNEADDTQRLIPRSAEVNRLGGETAVSAPGLPHTLSGTAVEAAAWQLVDSCRQAMAGIDPPLVAEQQAQVLAAIEVAAQALLTKLAGD